ncbi:MAG: hypothetical protein PHQ53_05410 [Candidatus Krumholzibacteria bacterium]|nr:hypothetical protein [Candidatus Krumholzibacteria bacterium]
MRIAVFVWCLICAAVLDDGVMATHDYVPCRNQFGIFRVSELPEATREHREALATLLDFAPTPSVPFSAHVMVIGATEPVLGYDATIDLGETGLRALDHAPPDGVHWINLGDALNILAGYNRPLLPDAAGNIHLSTLTLVGPEPRAGDIRMGPSTPSGVGGAGPTFNMGGRYVRANFLDRQADGCDEPAAATGRVATVFGGTGSLAVRGTAAQED